MSDLRLFLFGSPRIEYQGTVVEVERRKALALAAQNAGEPRYHKLLAALGRCLTTWGERLQDHYDAARQIPLE